MTELKLGRLPYQPSPRDFKLAAVIPSLPEPPKRFGHGYMYHGEWGMLANDQYGDCVFAGFAHQAMISSKLGRHPESFTDENVLADYSAVTGFNKDVPDSDKGTVVRDGLSYWRQQGIHTEDGGRHQIGAFISIPPKSWATLMSCVYVFSSVGIGWNVPNTIWEQWQEGEPFDVVDENAPIEGGHYTTVVGRTSKNLGGMITWGQRKSFTRDFYETYNDETWAMVFPDELKKGKNVRGYDLTQLNDLLASLG